MLRDLVGRAWDVVPTPVWDVGDFAIQLVFDVAHLARLALDSATDTSTRAWAEASMLGAEAARLRLLLDDEVVADMVGSKYVADFRHAEQYTQRRMGILGQS